MKATQMKMTHGQADLMNPAEGEANAQRERPRALEGPDQFGRMFDLPAFRPPDDALIALGNSMEEGRVPTGGQDDPRFDNPHIPAGYTYFGQFVDHDITFDRTVGFPVIDDPRTIEQARTPKLELDSLYGMGPVRQPELYEPGLPPAHARFRIGLTSSTPSQDSQRGGDVPVSLPHDLPRAPVQAVIADPRNDENLIVAQTHLAFLQLHNKVMDLPPRPGDDHPSAAPGTPFERAQRIVRWHYQWIVLHDWVRRIVIPEVLDDVLQCGRRFYRFEDMPGRRLYMPLEFSVAAYRLGHSMIREVYDYNRIFSHDPGAITPATLQLLFLFTGNQRPRQGQAPIPSNWIIDWRRFFPVDPATKVGINLSRRIDTRLTNPLRNLPDFANIPGEVPSLAQRNLLRGSRVGLPTGQDVARAMKVEPLPPEKVAGDNAVGDLLRRHGFHVSTPLWYYILKEAEEEREGTRLGAVGSRIVSEVFVGLLQGDKASFLHAPRWRPTLPAAKPGTFTMADLVRFVGNINPIGD